MIEKIIRGITKYTNSHVYDLSTYMAGLLSFVIVLVLKKKIKEHNFISVFGAAPGSDPGQYTREIDKKSMLKYHRRNLMIAAAAYILGCLFYVFYALILDRVRIGSRWFFVAGLVPIAIYTVIELLLSGWLGRLFFVCLTSIVFIANWMYCESMLDHHKGCIAVKYCFVIYGCLGILRQFFFVSRKDIEKYTD